MLIVQNDTGTLAVQTEADRDSRVHSVHQFLVHAPHLFPQTALIQRADLFILITSRFFIIFASFKTIVHEDKQIICNNIFWFTVHFLFLFQTKIFYHCKRTIGLSPITVQRWRKS